MEQYKINFTHLLLRVGALKFGEFTLKSGRIAPFFLNMGEFYKGSDMNELATYYAEALIASKMNPDIIFGPAYKGIPLAVATSMILNSKFGKSIDFAYNRKEVKDHGEGKLVVGSPIKSENRVLLIDDVITAGTALNESLEILKMEGSPKIEGALIALNRMEKNNEGGNAISEIGKKMNAPVHAIINMNEMIEILESESILSADQMNAIKIYRQEYGVL